MLERLLVLQYVPCMLRSNFHLLRKLVDFNYVPHQEPLQFLPFWTDYFDMVSSSPCSYCRTPEVGSASIAFLVLHKLKLSLFWWSRSTSLTENLDSGVKASKPWVHSKCPTCIWYLVCSTNACAFHFAAHCVIHTWTSSEAWFLHWARLIFRLFWHFCCWM